ncbi:MAG: pilus assembly protein TadG-related protein [Syntrophothermus sp.]
MKHKLNEKGQALVLIALAAIGLFGFSALAIDGSRVYSDRRHAQNAADTSALAAALARIRASSNPDMAAVNAATVSAAMARAESNGYANDSDSTVEVHMCNETGLNPPCTGLPGGANSSEFIQVKIVSTIPTTFARVIGRNSVTSMVTAIARATGAGPSPLANGAALAALNPHDPDTLTGNGVVHLDVNNSGVFNNSDNNCGTTINGASGSYLVDTSFQFVSGTYCSGAGGGQLNPVTEGSQIPYPPPIAVLTPTITCSGNGSHTTDAASRTDTYGPGNYPNGISLNSFGHVNFSPGNYCFGNSVTINGTADIIANNVRFKFTGGEFSTNGNSTLACNDMLVYINGGTGVRLNGNGGVYCNNVTFYAQTGDVSWNGNTTVRMNAPGGGDYQNLLIYMPYGNSNDLKINGNSNNELKGSIIAVSAPITISGNSGTTGLHSQIIGYTVSLAGSSNTVINYVPSEQYQHTDPSGIMLTK